MPREISRAQIEKVRKDPRFKAAVAAHAEVCGRADAIEAEIDAVYAAGTRDAMYVVIEIRKRYAAELAAAAKVVEKMILYGIPE